MCPNCDRKRFLNDKYCQNCGEKLKTYEEIVDKELEIFYLIN